MELIDLDGDSNSSTSSASTSFSQNKGKNKGSTKGFDETKKADDRIVQNRILDDSNIEDETTHGNSAINFLPNMTYLTTHFDSMYWMAYCPYQSTNESKQSILHWSIFTIISGISFFQTFATVKELLLKTDKKGDLGQFISAGYYIIVACLLLCYFVISTTKRIALLFANLYNLFGKTGGNNKKASKLGVFITLSSVILAINAFRLELLENTFTPKEILEIQAVLLKKDVFIWSSNNFKEKTDLFWETIDANQTTTVVLGMLQIWINFISTLQYLLIKNIMLVAALSVFCQTQSFKNLLFSKKNFDQKVIDKLWKEYEDVHQISEHIENCFGVLFIIQHVDNWLFCSYFLVNCFHAEFNVIKVFRGVVGVIIIFVTYFLSAVAHNVGGLLKHRAKIQSTNCNENTSNFKINSLSIEQNVNNSPVGLGRGLFIVNDNFLYKFTGSVVTCFLFLHKLYERRKEEHKN